jgi:hypothetical protein
MALTGYATLPPLACQCFGESYDSTFGGVGRQWFALNRINQPSL